MPSYLSPGVYNVEQDNTIGYGAAVSTSVGATVGNFTRGPVTGPVLITSPKQFINTFGIPNPTLGFATYQSLEFLRSSSQLWVQRVLHSDALYSGIMVSQGTGTPATQTAVGQGISTPTAYTYTSSQLFYAYAIGPGTYANGSYGISISSLNMLPITGLADTTSTSGTLPAATYTYNVTSVNALGENSPVALTVTTAAVGSVTLTWNSVNGASSYNVYRSTSGTPVLIASVAASNTATVTYADNGSATPGTQTPPTTSPTTPFFTLNVYSISGTTQTLIETYNCSMSQLVNGYGQQAEIDTQVNSQSQQIRIYNNIAAFASVPTIYSVPLTTMSGGTNGSAITDGDIINAWNNNFVNTSQLTLNILFDGGYTNQDIQNAILNVAATRTKCIAVLSVPSAYQSTSTQAVLYRNTYLNVNSNRGAIYAPDLLIYDPYNDLQLYIPPAGHAAGRMAHTDGVDFPWFAPAGFDNNRGVLNTVLGVRYTYDKGDRDLLSPAQVNAIINKPGKGIVIWDQHTLESTVSALQNINVRRLLDFIESEIDAAFEGYVFDPNDDFLARRLKSIADQVMEYVMNNQGVSDYQTIDNSTVNSSFTMNQGQRNVTILMTPILAASKIQLTPNLTPYGVSYSEIVKSLGA